MPADRTEKQKPGTQIQTRFSTKNKDKEVKRKKASTIPAPPPPPSTTPQAMALPPTSPTPIQLPKLTHSCPVEVIENILKYASQSTLGKCMLVSKVFYQVAAPLLYRNIVIKNEQSVSGVLSGDTLVDREPTRYASKVVNLKAPLLSMVHQITLNGHSCKQSSFTLDTCPYLKTLLIVPKNSHTSGAQWCRDRAYCPILQRARPEKVVIHSKQMRTPERHCDWPIFYHRLALSCPIVTVVFNEKDLAMNGEYTTAAYEGVEWKYVTEIRLIALNASTNVDDIARREPSLSELQEFKRLTHTILLPLLDLADVPVTMYLFRPFGPGTGRSAQLKGIMDTVLAKRYQDNLNELLRLGVQMSDGGEPLIITIKGLGDYIEEGWEDELLAEELHYWRKECKRRHDLIKAGAGPGKGV